MESQHPQGPTKESVLLPVAQTPALNEISENSDAPSSDSLRLQTPEDDVPAMTQIVKRQKSDEHLVPNKRQCPFIGSLNATSGDFNGDPVAHVVEHHDGAAACSPLPSIEPIPVESPLTLSSGSTIEDSDDVRQAAIEQALSLNTSPVPATASSATRHTASLERELVSKKESHHLLLQTLLLERRESDELREQHALLREKHEQLSEEHEELLQTCERLQERCDRLKVDARRYWRDCLRRLG